MSWLTGSDDIRRVDICAVVRVEEVQQPFAAYGDQDVGRSYVERRGLPPDVSNAFSVSLLLRIFENRDAVRNAGSYVRPRRGLDDNVDNRNAFGARCRSFSLNR